MTDLRKAAEMALEVLEHLSKGESPAITKGELVYEIAALRQALAQPEQEPVAWMHNFIEGNVITHKPADIDRNPDRWTALYKDLTPCKTCQALAMAVMTDQTYHEKALPKREWVGLTRRELDITTLGLEDLGDCYKAIEAKLKEKNVG